VGLKQRVAKFDVCGVKMDTQHNVSECLWMELINIIEKPHQKDHAMTFVCYVLM
jgi:hypothetical protein